MDQKSLNLRALNHSSCILKNPSTYNELEYLKILKPVEAHMLKELDRAVDECGTILINVLSDKVKHRKKMGEMMIGPHSRRGTKFGLVGLGSIGGSYISYNSLSKTIFVAGLVLCCGSAAELLYSLFLTNITAKAQKADSARADLIISVRDNMRLAIASQKAHRSTNQIIDQGVRKIDQHEENLDDHGSQLTAHSQKHVDHEAKIGDLNRADCDKTHQLDEQRRELSDHKSTIAAQQFTLDEQKGTIASQQRELNEQKSKLEDQESKFNEQKGTIVSQQRELNEQKSKLEDQESKFNEQKGTITSQQRELNEQKSKLATQDKTINDLVDKFKILENLLIAKAS